MTAGLLLSVYILFVNAVGFALMAVDKYRAIRLLSRVPEAVLFLFAIIGGCLGTTLGMVIFKHKTKHWYFRIFMPAILVMELAFFMWLFTYPGIEVTFW
ncbi:MAG: DUF1294 domain-containing protein [Lachnospiraceae bacterium]|nr:DUF1294 domain-containing protein [Lachnospiraceae bacterium]